MQPIVAFTCVALMAVLADTDPCGNNLPMKNSVCASSTGGLDQHLSTQEQSEQIATWTDAVDGSAFLQTHLYLGTQSKSQHNTSTETTWQTTYVGQYCRNYKRVGVIQEPNNAGSCGLLVEKKAGCNPDILFLYYQKYCYCATDDCSTRRYHSRTTIYKRGDSPTPSATAPYLLAQSGTCARPGYSPITDTSMCASAAQYLGLSDTTVNDDGQSGVTYDPPYCYFEKNSLKFNSNGLNKGSCTSYDKCLCSKACGGITQDYANNCADDTCEEHSRCPITQQECQDWASGLGLTWIGADHSHHYTPGCGILYKRTDYGGGDYTDTLSGVFWNTNDNPGNCGYGYSTGWNFVFKIVCKEKL